MFGKIYSPFLNDNNNNSTNKHAKIMSIGTNTKSYKDIGVIHFIGIGGIGMSGIAEVLLNLGYRVSGSDMKKSPITEHLEKKGAEIFYDHKKENVKNCSVVVYSSAVPMTNPEIREAGLKKIPIIPRAEMLNELVRMKKSIGIAGTHGKTTTTGMISFILQEAKLDPTMVVGGVLDSFGSNAHLGSGDYLVFEACEAYNSIDFFLPEISIVLNIDKDHMDCYENFDSLKSTFKNFLNKVPFYSFCVANGDDENIKDILKQITKRVITFGLSDDVDIKGRNITFEGMKTHFEVSAYGNNLGSFTLNIPGKHNVLNALAAISTTIDIGVEPEIIKKALCRFRNSERRFQVLYSKDNITVIDDYAHHPREIKATLEAAKNLIDGKNNKRLIAVFQPHLFSRTQMHYEGFAESLKLADKVFLTEIYPAREKPIPGVTTQLIFDLLKENSNEDVYYYTLDELLKAVFKELKTGDVILILGAGNITKTAHDLVKLIE